MEHCLNMCHLRHTLFLVSLPFLLINSPIAMFYAHGALFCRRDLCSRYNYHIPGLLFCWLCYIVTYHFRFRIFVYEALSLCLPFFRFQYVMISPSSVRKDKRVLFYQWFIIVLYYVRFYSCWQKEAAFLFHAFAAAVDTHT